ncbi:MAG: acyl-CoA dehydrogenase [Betaproteobacteria bacterium]|nr:acyl-CoA dehydrogenase [Betaproteobacteria bacterium]
MLLHNDDQQMLADSAQRYLERGYGSAARAAATADAHGCPPARWAEFAELGWLALPIPAEAAGAAGLGGSVADLCALAEPLGQALVVEPWLASAVLGAGLLADAAPADLASDWLPALAVDIGGVACIASGQADGGFLLHGDKALAPGAAGADAWLLLACLSHANPSKPRELGLFLVDAATPGALAKPGVLVDGQHAATIHLDGASVAAPLRRGPADQMLQMVERSLDRATLVQGAELVGAMAQALKITLAYLKTRRQFGRAIADNQVVQHRLVDLHVEIEEARAITRAAAATFDSAGDDAARRRWCAAAKACVAQAALHVWEESVQLHGAIGMTEACEIGAYVKRLAVGTMLYGDLPFHLDRLADLSLPSQA